MITSTGLFFAAATALSFTLFGLVGRVFSVRTENPLAFSVLYGFFGALFSLAVLIVHPGEFSGIDYRIVLITFLATVFYGLFEATEFFARKYLEVSRSTIFFQLVPVVTFIGSILFIGEELTGRKVAAVALILLGNLIAVYKNSGEVSRRGMVFAMLAVLGLGLAYVADKVAVVHYPLGIYLFISYLMPSVYISVFLFPRGYVSTLKKEWSHMSWRILVMALVGVVAYTLLLETLLSAEASVGVPIVFTSTILTALAGIVILKERSSVLQKLVGAVFAVLGVILLR